jgi:hypothetical protein
MKNIIFKLWNPAGLFNQVISVELGVGLATLSGRQITWHNIKNHNGQSIFTANYNYNDRNGKIDLDSFPRITDLLEWQNKDNHIFIDDLIGAPSENIQKIDNLMQYYYSNEDDPDFAEGRTRLQLDENVDWDIRGTLGLYSRFFNNRSDALNTALSSVNFKREYLEFAELVAKSLGDFNGAHLRLTDHVRAGGVAQNMNMTDSTLDFYEAGLSKLKGNLPIVLSTCEPSNEIITKSNREAILIDDYILNNFYNEFRELPFKEEVVLGLLSNLVMHHSQDFIGTPGSTFSAYIHRKINQKRDIGFKLFIEEDFEGTGKYSWNGYNKESETKQFWREWKESKI